MPTTRTFTCPVRCCQRPVFADNRDAAGRRIGTCRRCGPVIELLPDDELPPFQRPPEPEA